MNLLNFTGHSVKQLCSNVYSGYIWTLTCPMPAPRWLVLAWFDTCRQALLLSYLRQLWDSRGNRCPWRPDSRGSYISRRNCFGVEMWWGLISLPSFFYCWFVVCFEAGSLVSQASLKHYIAEGDIKIPVYVTPTSHTQTLLPHLDHARLSLSRCSLVQFTSWYIIIQWYKLSLQIFINL